MSLQEDLKFYGIKEINRSALESILEAIEDSIWEMENIKYRLRHAFSLEDSDNSEDFIKNKNIKYVIREDKIEEKSK